jgi:glutamate synthase domain-containing protein 3
MQIDAKGIHYKQLNAQIREAVRTGEKEIVLHNINGQRYIGDNMGEPVKIVIEGIAGNDLGFSLDGPELIVKANAQDGVGNTMGKGKIVIHGNAGDICGYAMRGGKIFIKGNVGYRSGIHMKEYQGIFPTIVIGGIAGDFLGEYMAGGVLVLLGMNKDNRDLVGNYCGTGMHGGRMFVRGQIPTYKLGREVKVQPLDDADEKLLNEILAEYKRDLNITENFDVKDFIKLIPGSKRPYGRMYAY